MDAHELTLSNDNRYLLRNLYLHACRVSVHYVCAILCTIKMTPKVTFTSLCTGWYAHSTAAYVKSRRFYMSKRKLLRGAWTSPRINWTKRTTQPKITPPKMAPNRAVLLTLSVCLYQPMHHWLIVRFCAVFQFRFLSITAVGAMSVAFSSHFFDFHASRAAFLSRVTYRSFCT
jgi:hypothetical protein